MYRSFGTIYRFRLQKSNSARRLLDPWIWDRYLVPKYRHGITILLCVKSCKTAGVIDVAEEVWNHAYWIWCYRL